MRRPILLVIALLGGVGCAAPPLDLEGVDRAELEMATDRRLEHARSLARRGAPGATPHLDALVARVSSATPQLRLSALLAADQAGPPRLRPGDRVEVQVVSQPSLGGERVVDPRGGLEVPPLGRVAAEGLTLDELSAAVAEALQKDLLQRRPGVIVRLIERAPATVQVTGRVGAHAGGAAPDGGPTVSSLTTSEVVLPDHRSLSLHELIGKAGGIAADADAGRLALVRTTQGPKGEHVRVAYHFAYGELVSAHLAGRDAWLRPGDHLIVPRLADVHLHGEVLTPGRHALLPGESVGSLIERAGGWTPGADRGGVLLLRGTEERPATLDEGLRPGDVVFVPVRERVYVVGKGVARNGSLTLPEGGLSAIQAISEAGWFTPTADWDDVTILRRGPSGRQRIPVPVDSILDGAPGEDALRLRPGDILLVPEVAW